MRPYNVPVLPGLLRGALGWGITMPLHASEPVWSLAPVWPWFGERFWVDKRKVGAGGGALGGWCVCRLFCLEPGLF
jgi:hypothetical protein